MVHFIVRSDVVLIAAVLCTGGIPKMAGNGLIHDAVLSMRLPIVLRSRHVRSVFRPRLVIIWPDMVPTQLAPYMTYIVSRTVDPNSLERRHPLSVYMDFQLVVSAMQPYDRARSLAAGYGLYCTRSASAYVALPFRTQSRHPSSDRSTLICA